MSHVPAGQFNFDVLPRNVTILHLNFLAFTLNSSLYYGCIYLVCGGKRSNSFYHSKKENNWYSLIKNDILSFEYLVVMHIKYCFKQERKISHQILF